MRNHAGHCDFTRCDPHCTVKSGGFILYPKSRKVFAARKVEKSKKKKSRKVKQKRKVEKKKRKVEKWKKNEKSKSRKVEKKNERSKSQKKNEKSESEKKTKSRKVEKKTKSKKRKVEKWKIMESLCVGFAQDEGLKVYYIFHVPSFGRPCFFRKRALLVVGWEASSLFFFVVFIRPLVKDLAVVSLCVVAGSPSKNLSI